MPRADGEAMAFWNPHFEVEEIEQLALIDRLPTIMIRLRRRSSTRRNHDSPIITNDFFNSIDPKPTSDLQDNQVCPKDPEDDFGQT